MTTLQAQIEFVEELIKEARKECDGKKLDMLFRIQGNLEALRDIYIITYNHVK